ELASALSGSKSVFSLFITILLTFIPTQLPLGILEGFLTGGMLVFVYRRRPDIFASLHIIEKGTKIIFTLLIAVFLFTQSHRAFAEEEGKWAGVDVTVVEKIAEQHGRSAWTPFINTDQGDLLLFVFLSAGTIGGFLLGYNYRKLFAEKNDKRGVL
ncbi:MAG: energy-coupling factor ABC transporter permease, partial [Candidatus Omnitrophica bacterium]|nr:energy-coupling factor ABC transporter permease [Candidatus Omnitrophota bacterium]